MRHVTQVLRVAIGASGLRALFNHLRGALGLLKRHRRLLLSGDLQEQFKLGSKIVVRNQEVLANVDEHLGVVLEPVLLEGTLEDEVLLVVVDARVATVVSLLALLETLEVLTTH